MSESDALPFKIKSDFGGFQVSADDVATDSDRPARSLAGSARAVRLTTEEKLRDPNATTKELADALGVSERTAQRYRKTGQLPKGRTKDLTNWHRKLRRRKSYDDSDLNAKRDAAAEAKWGRYGTPTKVRLNGTAGISGSKRGIKVFRGGPNAEVELDPTAADDLRRAYANGDEYALRDTMRYALDSWFNNTSEKTIGDDFRIDPA